MVNFDLKEEIRCDFIVSQQRKKIWYVELEILEQLLRTCQKYGLKCWLDSGSLLGAVRHHGFIPWDDDIDLVMMREDYDKLMEIGPKEFCHPFFFQSAYTDKIYPRGHIQIRNTETTAILPLEYKREFNQGIFIDIFPLDALPDDEIMASDLKVKIICMRNILYSYKYYPPLGLKVLPNLFRTFKAYMLIGKDGFRKYYHKYEEILRKNKIQDNRLLTKISSFETKYKGIDKHLFDDTVWMDFETIKVPVPSGYDQYLRLMFGESYMIPKRCPSLHNDIFFDPDNSYTKYLPSQKAYFRHLIWKEKVKKIGTRILALKNDNSKY